jgi:hypothetical protein
MPFPQWQTSESNIDRTNDIFRRIADEFGPQFQTVSAIQPVNEFVQSLLASGRVANNQNLGPLGLMGRSCSIPLANTT